MYKVALVQNQSEMSHYSYADARPIIRGFGYEVKLYTEQNIERLSGDITSEAVDSVIIASHAQNDIEINKELRSDRFRDALKYLLDSGKGCLILHQLRLGEKARDSEIAEGRLSYLPEPYSSVSAMARPREELSAQGRIGFPVSAREHFLLHYPNELHEDAVKSRCFERDGLKGLYWHYWANVDASRWDVLMVDDSPDLGEGRVLLASSKELTNHRIVICSLTLDWQKQEEVLGNVIPYVVEGRQHIAFLVDDKLTSVGQSYMLERLRSERRSYRKYVSSSQADDLVANVERGYNSIIVSTQEGFRRLGPENQNRIQEVIDSGRVKLIIMDGDRFTVSGKERDATSMLRSVEVDVQRALNTGYVDNSFWSTVASLQVLERIDITELTLDRTTLSSVLDTADLHDKNGSYDEVFGATSALLWLRSKYLGADNPKTIESANWIRNAIEGYDRREQVQAYLSFIQSGYSEQVGTAEEDRSRLLRAIASIDYSRAMSELDAITYLRAANEVVSVDAMRHLSELLCMGDMQTGRGLWVDVSTTASAVVALLDARGVLMTRETRVGEFEYIDASLFSAITAIRDAKSNASGDELRFWGSKTSTNLECIEALLRFESLIELPVTEIIKALETYSGSSAGLNALSYTLSAVSTLSEDFDQLKERNAEYVKQLDQERQKSDAYPRLMRFARVSSNLSALLIYIVVMLLWYLATGGTQELTGFLLEKVAVHVAFIALLATVNLGLSNERISSWVERSSDG